MPCRHIAAPADSSVAPTRTTTSVECMEIATPPQHTTLGEDFDSTGDEGDTPRSRVSVSLPTWFLYITWVLPRADIFTGRFFHRHPEPSSWLRTWGLWFGDLFVTSLQKILPHGSGRHLFGLGGTIMLFSPFEAARGQQPLELPEL